MPSDASHAGKGDSGNEKKEPGNISKKLAGAMKSLRKENIVGTFVKLWWLWCLISIVVFTYWTWALPARYGELLGLDEFYMYRMSQYVLDHNFQIPGIDYMRYWPDGIVTANSDFILQYYVPIVFYYIAMFLGFSMPFFNFALLWPALSGAFSVIVMFLIGKDLFNDKRAGLLSAIFLATAIGYVSRTSGALYEKESVGGPFILLFFFFFLRSYKKGSIPYGIAAGASLAMASVTWGGSQIAYFVVPAFIILQLLVGKCSTSMMKAAIPSMLIAIFVEQLYKLSAGVHFSDMLTLLSISLLAARYAVERYGIVKKEKLQYFIPGVLAAIVLFVLVGSMFSDYLWGLVQTFLNFFIMNKGGVIATTVAEQMAGDWNEIISRFDVSYSISLLPQLESFKVVFSLWFLMLAGGAILLYTTVKKRSPSYLILALALSFAAYFVSPIASIFLVFAWAIGITFISKNYDDSKDARIFVFLWLMFSAATVFYMVRLVFFVAPPAALAAAFLVTRGSDFLMTSKHTSKYKIKSMRGIPVVSIAIIAFVAMLLLANMLTSYAFLNSAGPMFNSYWKDAMNYMATQTPVNSSILSWWDFGYWFQTRGQRPSIADGGNNNGTVNVQTAEWFVSNSKNWTSYRYWYKGKDVKYILMDYSLPGKYGAISKIASGGNTVTGMLQFQQTTTYPQENKTIVEYAAGEYIIWIPVSSEGGIAGPPIFMITSNGQYAGKSYITDICTTNGIIHINVPEGSQIIPGCITLAPYGLFYIPQEAEFTIFTNLMFMDGYGIPDVQKVFDNQLIKIYKLEINETLG
jgi:asparagine N-glycosylation enzyme membrane subunit Stt3